MLTNEVICDVMIATLRKDMNMKHRILTCKNHPNLRWSCKDIAWSGHYNGMRNIFFNGTPSGDGMYSDGSGLNCSMFDKDNVYVEECSCPSSDLILAPEDSLVVSE
jgi:hypothetical protein